MPEGFDTYHKNKKRYRFHMRQASKKSVRLRTAQVHFEAVQMVGFESGDLMQSTKAVFRDGGMTGLVHSGAGLTYAAHHHFPGVTRRWSGNPYMRVPFDHHAPKMLIDIARAHNTFRPLPV